MTLLALGPVSLRLLDLGVPEEYGRDSLITRLVRGERKEIAKSYKLGFAALRYYSDSQRASLILAKNDGRLWLLLKGLAIVEMPMEIREKIVDFAFLWQHCPHISVIHIMYIWGWC